MTQKSTLRAVILAGVISTLILPMVSLTTESALAKNRHRQHSWRIVLAELFSRQRVRPISRGERCLIASRENYVFYNTRPVFVWKGQLDKIAIANLGEDNPLWDTEIHQNGFAAYTGKENLQPGVTYELQGFIQNRPVMLVEFKIMNPQQRQIITTELNALEQQLKTEGADKHAIALERANYFIQKQLWSDALQEAYTLENPPAELSQILSNLPEKLCANN